MTHKKKKTLSDNISFLLSNASGTLVNPDEDINTESQARVIDEDDLDSDLSDSGVAPSKLRQRNVALLDSLDRKYRGGATTRKALKNLHSGSDDDGQSEADGQSSEAGDDGEDSQDDDFDDSEEEAIADLKKTGSESFASYTDFDVEDDSNDDVEEEEDNEGGDSDNEGNAASGEEDSTTGGFQHFSVKDTNEEVKKGQCVCNQLAVWDTLMECRIQLQKVVTFSNQLPQGNAMQTFQSQGGSTFNSNLAKVENTVTKLLDSLLNLQEKLLKQYPETQDLNKTNAKLIDAPADDGMDEEIPSSDDEKEEGEEAILKEKVTGSDGSDEEMDDVGEESNDSSIESDVEDSKPKRKNGLVEDKPTKRRKLNDYSILLAKHHKEFTPYLNNTIRKWNTKTQVAVGRASSKNFSGFEQSTLQQIEHILADKNRLVRRTQLRRSDFKVLGQIKNGEDKESEEPKEGQAPPDVPTQEDQKSSAEANKEYDPEIFDDTDFYHQLLRELIEKKTADVTDPVQLGRQWIALQKMRSKMKRKVDVKASKGRRLRYSVHPKLVNFMAPQPELLWSDEAKNELYASLFGQRKS